MIGFLQTAFAFILVLGILVFVHEFGHFLAAKSFGIAVPTFSLGFGPRLFGFRRKETDYRISLIPLGGYVRMAGDEADEQRTGAPEEFLSRPRWQRFVVFVAGATFNIVLALLVMWLALWLYGKQEVKIAETPPVVARVLDGSTAQAAGIRQGDRILKIEGRDARDPKTRFEEEVMSPGAHKTIELERDGAPLSIELDMGSDSRYHLGFPGWQLLTESGSPAGVAGAKTGDRVLAADDRDGVTELELRAMLEASPGRGIELKIDRLGTTETITVVPRSEGGKGRIGVTFRPVGLVHRDLSFLEAGAESVEVNLDLSKTLFLTLRKLVGGEISVRAFAGPMEIARASREAVRRFEWFLGFLAFISLQLGILNLLPIPVLDGGHILILAVEGVMRRDFSDAVKERIMQVGLVFLLGFFAVIMYFDVIKAFFTNLKPTLRNRTTLMTFSEFGRKPHANDSRGTDHSRG